MIDEELLLRFLTHRCTDSELQQIAQWASEDKSNAEWLFDMEQVWSLKDQLYFSDQQKIANAYWKFISGKDKREQNIESKKTFSITKHWIRYAAAAVVALLLSFNIYQLNRDISQKEEGWNTIEVPQGQSIHLKLSDGSTVWLNSQSKFEYPSPFSIKDRKVKLEGEAYFEIVKNEKKPFTVSMPHLDVKVLGTKFNATAYPDEIPSVALIEGKVEVFSKEDNTEIILSPNERAFYSSEDGLKKMICEDVTFYQNWRLGKFSFVDQRLDVIMRALERKFDYKVTIVDLELAEELFTCNTIPNPSLKDILELLKSTRKIDYKIKNKEVLIFKSNSL